MPPSRVPAPGPAERCQAGTARPAMLATPPMRIVVSAADGGAGAPWLERYLLRQQYATLIAADCEGLVRPGVAASWRAEDGGLAWTFWLRDGLRLADGAPLDAAAVVAMWRGLRADTALWPGVTGMTAVGVRALRVNLRQPVHDPVHFFHPAYALRGARGEPTGTHALLLPGGDSAPPGEDLATLEPLRPLVGRSPVLARLLPAATDHRDLLDLRQANAAAEVTVHVTRDPRVVAHARADSSWEVLPLGWDRTYVLTARSAGEPLVGPSDADLAALARDAVTGVARAAPGEPWWERTDCLLPAPQMLPVGRQLGYDPRDPAARALAERIVALAGSAAVPAWIPAVLRADPGRPGAARAVPMDSLSLLRGLASGTVVAAITAVAPLPSPGCEGAPPRLPGGAVMPLVQTRAWALVRGRLPSIVLLGDGTFQFASPQ